jgi:hypothetical protein
MLTVTAQALSGTIDLTAVGIDDWIHYGLSASTTVTRKASPLFILPTYIHIGTTSITRTTSFGSNVSWTDGDPTAESAGTATGIYKSGDGYGFKYIIPTAVSPRQVNLYVRTSTTAQLAFFFQDYSEFHSNVSLSAELSNVSIVFASDVSTNLIVEFTQTNSSGYAYLQAMATYRPNEKLLDEYETCSVEEVVTVELSEEPGMMYYGVNDATSLSEDVASHVDLNPSVVEAVSVVDYASAGGERFKLTSNLPVHKLEAEFSPTFQLVSNLPVPELTGQFGFRMVSRVPVPEITGSMSEAISFSLVSKLPVHEMTGRFGWRMESKLPVHQLSGEFNDSQVFTLSSRIPIHTINGTLLENETFQLAGYIPPRLFSATISEKEVFILTSKIPIHTMKGTLREEGTFSLVSKLPVHVMSATLLCTEFILESNLPVHTMTGRMYDGEHWTLVSNLPVYDLDGYLYDMGMQLVSYLPVHSFAGVMSEEDISSSSNPDASIDEDSFIGVLRYIRP